MDSVDTLLSMQNANGGFASYELVRGPHWLELFNHAEVFGRFPSALTRLTRARKKLTLPRPRSPGNIMTEYNYPECTTSALSALEMFTKRFPDYRADEIRRVRTSYLSGPGDARTEADPLRRSASPQADGQGRHQVHPHLAACRRQLVRLVGHQLHLCVSAVPLSSVSRLG